MHSPCSLVCALSIVALLAGCGEVVFEGQEVDGGDVSGEDGRSATGDGYEAQAVQELLDLPSVPFSYEPELPAHFQVDAVVGLDNTRDNPITDEGATLGRVLFYDPLLSSNETIACASCHQQDRGFADSLRQSDGFAGGKTQRNSMSLINLRYYQSGRMFWDERADSIEHQVLLPIQDPVEMGLALQDVVSRLENTEHYPILFALAFGDSEISSERVSLALGQFVRSIVSTSSRYDEAIAISGTPMGPFTGFTQQENLGKDLFFGPPEMGGAGCAVCHLAPPPNLAVFQPTAPRNNGMVNANAQDQGVGSATGIPQDNGRFKVPSLRNVARTAPYMHDGSLASLRDVIEHYNGGIQEHPNLDPVLRGEDGAPIRLGLTEDEVAALEAFLGTLTDSQLLTEERFSSPFR